MTAIRKAFSGGRALVLLGGLLGFMLILYGVWRFASSGRPAEADGRAPAAKVTQVVTAAKALVRGQLIQAGDLKSTAISGVVPAGALTSPAQADGKIAIVDIQPQQLILENLVSADAGAAGLAMLVPVGQRVFSTDVTDDVAVGGFLRPGDTVDIEIVLPQDVIGGQQSGPDRSESRTLLQNIRVLTVGPTFGQPGGTTTDGKERPSARALTLAMNPDQIAPFMLARKLGHFYLLLRNPGDQAVVADGRSGLASLRGNVPAIARAVPVASRVVPRAPPPRAIELIVGGQRQIIYPDASDRR
ncbi:MAG: Flp pilus assembly protein CpaB [Janthinobacterium lividum]